LLSCTCRSDIGLNATYLQALFFCADVAHQDDIVQLAQAASLVLTSQDNVGMCSPLLLLLLLHANKA